MSRNTKKIEKALVAKGYPGSVEWFRPNGMGGVDGYCCDSVRRAGKSEFLGYSLAAALAYVDTLPAIQ